jgi:hypothetical protein
VAAALPADTTFHCVDFSARMLAELRRWLDAGDPALAHRVTLALQSLGDWAGGAHRDTYGLVLLLEVGEFVPGLTRVLERAAESTARGGGLVMTRPAGLWAWAFPGRSQSRRALRTLLLRSGYLEPEFVPWRSRYELVLARKA